MSNILFKSDIADTLDYNRSDMALSARQGRALKQMLASIKKDMMLEAHPVGSIYWSMEATDPGQLFGGTWEQIKDRFIWATTSTPGNTGGEATHTLTISEMPKHGHPVSIYHVNAGTTDYFKNYAADGVTLLTNQYGIGLKTDYIYTWSNQNKSAGSGIGDNMGNALIRGGGQPHNNMPPYLEAYCWKRTA